MRWGSAVLLVLSVACLDGAERDGFETQPGADWLEPARLECAPLPERWNGRDDDCDGRVDEAISLEDVADVVVVGPASGYANGVGGIGGLLSSGDVDGDGRDDLMTLDPNGDTGDDNGPGWLFLASDLLGRRDADDSDAALEFVGGREEVTPGMDGELVPDLDGDGGADLLVSPSDSWDRRGGLAWSSTLLSHAELSDQALDAHFQVGAGYAGSGARWSLAVADLTGDGDRSLIFFGRGATDYGLAVVPHADLVAGEVGAPVLLEHEGLGFLKAGGAIDDVAGEELVEVGRGDRLVRGLSGRGLAEAEGGTTGEHEIFRLSDPEDGRYGCGEEWSVRSRVAAGGDFDGDGRADLAVGCVDAPDDVPWPGVIYLWDAAALVQSGPRSVDEAPRAVVADVPFRSVAVAWTELDDDGRSDLVVTAWDGEHERVWLLTGAYLSSGQEVSVDGAVASFVVDPPRGYSSIATPDLDGDGAKDIALGAVYADVEGDGQAEGRIVVLLNPGSL